MSRGIANHDGARPAVDRGRIQTLDHGRIAAAGVLGDIHAFEAERHGELHGFLRGLEQEVIGPAFGVAANRAGANKGRGLNVQPGALHDLGNRPDVIFVGARGAVGANLHFVADDLVGQRLAIRKRARSRSRQAQIERVDAQGFHQMQDLNFLRNRGIAHRGRLQPIAQGLIVEQDFSGWPQLGGIHLVPVVDKFGSIQCEVWGRAQLSYRPWTTRLPLAACLKGAPSRQTRYYFFGATVNPNTDVWPCPATFSPRTPS